MHICCRVLPSVPGMFGSLCLVRIRVCVCVCVSAPMLCVRVTINVFRHVSRRRLLCSVQCLSCIYPEGVTNHALSKWKRQSVSSPLRDQAAFFSLLHLLFLFCFPLSTITTISFSLSSIPFFFVFVFVFPFIFFPHEVESIKEYCVLCAMAFSLNNTTKTSTHLPAFKGELSTHSCLSSWLRSFSRPLLSRGIKIAVASS